MNSVITIGRQFGSGGHEAGKRLAARLGIPFYDKKLLSITAENSRFAESYLKKMDEKKPSLLNFGSSVLPAGSVMAAGTEGFTNFFYNLSANDQVFLEFGKVMHELAGQGPCVIVGRCADYILRDMNSINFFLSANIEDRIKRKMALEDHEHLDEQQMEKLIVSTDKNRSKYYEYYTHEKWGDSRHYHLCIDTSSVGVDGAVRLMEMFVEEYHKFSIMPDL